MKKTILFIAAAVLVALVVPAWADNDRVIGVEKLPAAAQQFIKTHFASSEVSYAKVDKDVLGDEYKVVFTTGATVEFDQDGEWIEIDGKRTAIPAAAVPQQIRETVTERFPGRTIRKIERKRRGFEVKLDNGVELEFDRAYNLVDIDD